MLPKHDVSSGRLSVVYERRIIIRICMVGVLYVYVWLVYCTYMYGWCIVRICMFGGLYVYVWLVYCTYMCG